MLTTQLTAVPTFLFTSSTVTGTSSIRSWAAPAVETSTQHTITELVNMYMLKVKSMGAGSDTIAKNCRELGRFADFMAARDILHLRAFGLPPLLDYMATWNAAYPAASTRKLVRHRLLQFLTFCVEIGELVKVPTISRIIAKSQAPTMPLSQGEFARLLAVASNGKRPVRGTVMRDVRRAVVLLMRWSGASITDAIMMKRECIFYDAGKGFHRCRYRRQKTGVLVNNPLPTEIAEEILNAARTCSSPTHLFQLAGKEGIGGGAKRRWVDWFHKTFVMAGMPQGHSHQLRDTFAAALFLQRVPLEAVAKALGHTSVKTTERYYAPWIKERQDLLDSTLLDAMEQGAAVATGGR